MGYFVTAADLNHISLNEPEEVRAVLQNVALILATPKGSAPMYRDFGLPQDFVDKPMPAAKTRMLAAVREAIEQWEPRAQVRNVDFAEDAVEPGELVPVVEMEIQSVKN